MNEVKVTEIDVILKSLDDFSNRFTTKKAFNEQCLDIYLKVACDLNNQDFLSTACEIEKVIVDNLDCDFYEYQEAYLNHKRRFAQRHIMGVFLFENLKLIKLKALESIVEKRENKREKIFVYWNSIGSSPEIINKCHNNLIKNVDSLNFEILFLNRNNYKEYVEIDDAILDKLENEVQFSDLLRMALLNKYGGFWLDATCLVTNDFYEATKNIVNNEFFFFRYSKVRIGTWFIWSKKNNYVVAMILEALKLWWIKEGYLTNYFMLHDICEMLYWIDDDYKKKWDQSDNISISKALRLFKKRHEYYNEKEFENIIKNSFIHKLTYKRIDKLLLRETNMKVVIDKF